MAVLVLFGVILLACAAEVVRLARDARADADSEQDVFDRRRQSRLAAWRRLRTLAQEFRQGRAAARATTPAGTSAGTPAVTPFGTSAGTPLATPAGTPTATSAGTPVATSAAGPVVTPAAAQASAPGAEPVAAQVSAPEPVRSSPAVFARTVVPAPADPHGDATVRLAPVARPRTQRDLPTIPAMSR